MPAEACVRMNAPLALSVPLGSLFAADPRRLVQVSTIAYAVVYFEKIILKKHVNKENRKLMAAVCVMLAAKFWEPTITSESRMHALTALLEESFTVPKKRLFAMEMTVFADLDFSLLLPYTHVYPHFVRLLAEHYNVTPQEYAPYVPDPVLTQAGYGPLEYKKHDLRARGKAALVGGPPPSPSVISVDLRGGGGRAVRQSLFMPGTADAGAVAGGR